MDNPKYVRPQTPQALLHRAPNKPVSTLSKPNKYIILILASTSVAGKVQIATSVAKALSCPLFQGDSLHESSAKAASVGASRSEDGGRGRYQRMWLNKMTRTGLLFPDESKPANEGFSSTSSGLSSTSTSTSRRGSASSISSTNSSIVGSMSGSTVDDGNPLINAGDISSSGQYINQSVFAISKEERSRKLNPALMVLTHPDLDTWHKDTIRKAMGEYGIGIIFVPLGKTNSDLEDEEPPLRLLDPSVVSEFTSFDALKAAAGLAGDGKNSKYGFGKKSNLDEEMVLKIDVGASVEDLIEDIVNGVKDVMAS
jgi:hypothetical protein